MAYSQTWLEDQSSIKALFIVATVYNIDLSIEQKLYLSTANYATADGSMVFNPILTENNGEFTESISLDGGISVSYGDVEIYNDGTFDRWLDSEYFIWVNRPIKLYLGDPFWATADTAEFETDFLLIFDGLIADIDVKNINLVNLKFRDKLERLNTPVTEDRLGVYGTWAYGQNNKDVIKPLVFGEVHNSEPLLIDPAYLQYMVNNGNTESCFELRDNGVPIYTEGILTGGANVTLSTGTLTLTHPLVGQMTATVQGVKNSVNLSTGALINGTYNNNVANLIALIVTQYGKQSTRLDGTVDIDLTNFSDFQSSHTQHVGIWIADRVNVLDVCQQLADSVGAQVFFTKTGKLQLLKLGYYTPDATVTIYPENIVKDSLALAGRSEVRASTKLAYCKCWTVQEGLVTGIPEQHKDMFATEWFYAVSTDATTKTNYKLDTDPVAKETLLLTRTEAEPESLRINNYFKVPRTIYTFTGTARLLSLKLGQHIKLIHPRFNLYNFGYGKDGQVISLKPNWLKGTIEVGVII